MLGTGDSEEIVYEKGLSRANCVEDGLPSSALLPVCLLYPLASAPEDVCREGKEEGKKMGVNFAPTERKALCKVLSMKYPPLWWPVLYPYFIKEEMGSEREAQRHHTAGCKAMAIRTAMSPI